MLSTLSIGLVGGLVTGLSPCILPILPLVLAVSGNGGRSRPWLVIGGLVTSFTAVTLFATTLLNALHLPGDLVWKVGIGLLVLVGLGMMFPKFQEILEWPFLKLPKAGGLQAKARDKGGFAVGLALGVVFVPCAGPVLAAISVAGATGTIDAHILILCLAFAVGVAIPLMAFALGGNEVGKRVDFFQSHQRGFRFGAGVVVIAMAGAIAVGAPAWLQQKLLSPEFGQEVLAKEASSSKAGQQVPEFQGLTGWFNTDEPVDPRTNGKVTLIDFWAYACINCQRNNVHLTKIYDHYKDSGLEVVGIHAPEYSFEREAANVQRAAREQESTTPLPKTTTSPPGVHSKTSTGQRTTSLTHRESCANLTTARAITPKPKNTSASCLKSATRTSNSPRRWNPPTKPPRRAAIQRPTSARRVRVTSPTATTPQEHTTSSSERRSVASTPSAERGRSRTSRLLPARMRACA